MANRRYKDSVFRMYLNNREELARLYQALRPDAEGGLPGFLHVKVDGQVDVPPVQNGKTGSSLGLGVGKRRGEPAQPGACRCGGRTDEGEIHL